jgi:hypothetical protein
MTLSLVLLYKQLLEESARHQRSDTARKLAAHRVAWAAMASARTANASPAAAPGSAPAEGTQRGSEDDAPPVDPPRPPA